MRRAGAKSWSAVKALKAGIAASLGLRIIVGRIGEQCSFTAARTCWASHQAFHQATTLQYCEGGSGTPPGLAVSDDTVRPHIPHKNMHSFHAKLRSDA